MKSDIFFEDLFSFPPECRVQTTCDFLVTHKTSFFSLVGNISFFLGNAAYVSVKMQMILSKTEGAFKSVTSGTVV